jgi:hypothetical protein
LQKKYNGSPSLLLSTVYPEHNWLPWKFALCPKNYWEDDKNQRKFIEWAEKQFNIKEMSDWYNITHKVTLPLITNNIKRIYMILGVTPFYVTTTIPPFRHYFPNYSQTTNGYHGNSKNPPEISGTI